MAKPSEALLAAKREAQHKKALGKRNSNTIIVDIYQKAIDSKKMVRNDTGLVFDRSMAEHQCLWDDKYPECPERLVRVLERCEELNLIQRCKYIEPRNAEYSELLLKHSPVHIETLKSTDNCQDVDKLEKLASKYDAVYFHPKTYQLSLLATGSTINLIENICKGIVQNGMAIIRPPGHHAMKSEYCGYCFFNNVAVAAEVALKNNLVKKILIVDWDVHHGQATQQMFYNDARVVYFSIHRYENGEFWPNLRESDYHYVGEGAGEGYNFNVPLNKTGMTNADYLAIFQQVLLPMAYEFQPDLIIVSAGYDAALGCPEGLMNITPACYAHLLSSLMSLAGGKVAVILEGGYCLKSLAESAALTLRTLLGDPCPMMQSLEPVCQSIQETILNVIYAHRAYWKCYQYQDSYSIDKTSSINKKDKHLPTVSFNGPETFPTVYETRNCYPVQSNAVIREINRKLDELIKITNLKKAPNRVCVVYDERMLKHYNVVDETHPEKPGRISSIFSKHKDYELLDRCLLLQGRVASEEEILLAHDPEYVNSIKKTAQTKLKELVGLSSKMNSVYLHPETWNSATVAAGSLLQVVDSVLNGDSQSGVAMVRPPGHHAEPDAACGFCIFNNIAIAAKYAVSFHQLKRVLVVDWDIHHGNGTQSILYDDPKVLYVSLHRYDNGSFFPHSKSADYSVVGEGRGEGYNVNIPWNKKGMGDAEYVAAFQHVVMPIAYQYNPELVLVSAGFDACIGDPLGGCKVSPEMFGHMTFWLSSLANGRIILSLEGGYNVNSIGHAMSMCSKALLGDPLVPLEANLSPCSSAVTSIMNVLRAHKRYWPNLVFQKSLPQENVLPKAKIPRAKPTERLLSDFLEKQHSPANDQLPVQVDRLNIHDDDSEKMSEPRHAPCDNDDPNNDKSKTEPDNSAASSSNDAGEQGSAQAGSSQSSTNNATLQDYLKDNLQALLDEDMFAVVPLQDCPHLSSVAPVPEAGIDIQAPCVECDSTLENWVCLECYTIHCARNVRQHALLHERSSRHPLTLSFTDLSVWCYACEAYIDNPILYAARNAVHQKKFNTELPWTYSESTEIQVLEALNK
ncbi:histone deacetylase 6 [Copidosoma floridanum]|uniref:histone deacetylase 6 n=1 Tax=Copidosoma floridanum TaxID=29053 RepID=UPI0006C95F7D|nr:histone deacetylase 6 [Copidosoma floridanum]